MDLVLLLFKLTIRIITIILRGVMGALGRSGTAGRRSAASFLAVGKSIRIVDGDTIRIGTERIRLFGIDAPEREQAGGHESSEALRFLVNGKDLRITPVSRDVYDRIVARVHRADGMDICREMVRQGWAHATEKGPYTREMRDAKRARRGIWRTDRWAMDPAKYRANHKPQLATYDDAKAHWSKNAAMKAKW